MIIRSLLLVLCIYVLFLSCIENGKKCISPFIDEWQGKEIVFPKQIQFVRFTTEPVDYSIPHANYKVLIYADSAGCTSCKLQLHKWKEFMEYVDSITGEKIPFLFFFHPKDRIEIKYLLKSYEIDRPVCIDLDDQLNKLNNFRKSAEFQTFLLDKNNKVVVSGNPIDDIDVKDLYLKKLMGKESPTKSLLKTTAESTQTEIDFGTFDKLEKKEAIIEVKNTGDNPLVIVDVSTTCGCTAATFEQNPAKPGGVLRVGIKMTPKDTGFFDEVVTIKFNSLNNLPVKVKIKGNVR